MDHQVYLEISAIDVQLSVGREREADVLTLRVFDLSQHDVGGEIHLQRGGNQELVLRGVGIDMESWSYAKIERDLGLLPLLSSHCSDRGHRNRRSLAGLGQYAPNQQEQQRHFQMASRPGHSSGSRTCESNTTALHKC